MMQSEGWRQRRFPLSGSRNDDEFDPSSQGFSLTPTRQLGDMVRPYQIEEGRPAVALPEMADRVDRVADASPFQFDRIDAATGLPSQGQTQPAEPLGTRGWKTIRLEWGLGGGDEHQLIKAQFLKGSLRHQKVSAMHGIKGAPVEANSHGWRIPGKHWK